MTDNGIMREKKIEALEGALASAQQGLDKVIQELTNLATAFRPPENEAIKSHKERLGVSAKNWDDACQRVKADLKKLRNDLSRKGR